jgi:hypothetical protein
MEASMSNVQLEQPSVTVGEGVSSDKGANQSDVINLGKVLNSANPERGIADLMDRLAGDARSWEGNELARSNDRLYAILTECYTMNNAMVGSDIAAKALRKGMANYIEGKGYIFNESTPLMTKIVKCVFGSDRKRVNAYATTLIVARKAEVQPIKLASWIGQQGGVEEIRRGAAGNKTKSIDERVAAGKAVLAGEVLASIKSDRLSASFDIEKLTDGVVLLATHEDDGTFAIRRVLQTESVVKAAIAACGDISAKEQKKAEVEAQAKADDQAREAVREQLKAA